MNINILWSDLCNSKASVATLKKNNGEARHRTTQHLCHDCRLETGTNNNQTPEWVIIKSGPAAVTVQKQAPAQVSQ